jgi:hypothetical protein
MSDTTFYQKLMAMALNVFDAYSAVLFLPDPGSEDCRVAAYYSLGDDVRADVVITPGMGLAGWIIRNQKPLLVGNFDQKRGFLGYYDQKDEARIRAFMGCPVIEGGAVCLDSRKTFTFGEKDQKILGQFAEMAGAHAASERRRADEGRDARYYRALAAISGLRRTHPTWPAFQSSLLRILSETSGFSSCFLAVRDESGNCYSLDAMNRGLFENPWTPAKILHGPGTHRLGFQEPFSGVCRRRRVDRRFHPAFRQGRSRRRIPQRHLHAPGLRQTDTGCPGSGRRKTPGLRSRYQGLCPHGFGIFGSFSGKPAPEKPSFPVRDIDFFPIRFYHCT